MNKNNKAYTCIDEIQSLHDFIIEHQPLFVLTGAGCSTDSGIPDYRDYNGNWKHDRPVQYADFISSEVTRKKYWLRSMHGWPRVATATPNPTHTALSRLERANFINYLVTQNVDSLHHKAGCKNTMSLHGDLDSVICIECDFRMSRKSMQQYLEENNNDFLISASRIAPDGYAVLDEVDYSTFTVKSCPNCNSILKPDIVFFGENIPRSRVVKALEKLVASKGLLIIGSSLMVYSGYRFCRHASEHNIPIAAINLGRTRADDLFQLKLELPCAEVMSELAGSLCA